MQVPAPARPLRVLAVDDAADVLTSLRILLGLWGHQPATAGDGQAALQRAAVFQPDVVLLEVALPDMSGHELARRLRQTPGLHAVTLVAVTGVGQAADPALRSDFDYYFLKPVNLDALQALLGQLALSRP